MAARNRDLKTFVSNNGSDREVFRISRSDDQHLVAPIEAISDGESAYSSTPYGRYTASEVMTMWSEMLKQLNFEEKLKSFYESLMNGLEERHKSTQEKMEQDNRIMQALMREVCDQISACFAPPQTSGQPNVSTSPTSRATSSIRLSRTPRRLPQHLGSQQLHEERAYTPNVILTSPDGEFTASDFQVDGESTYAIFVSRNDHERIKNMLSCEVISYLVEINQSTSDDNIRRVRRESSQRLFSSEATNVSFDDADHRHSATTIKGDGDHLIDHDVQGSEEEVRVKPGFWNHISDRKGDAEVVVVTVKEMKMAQQQQQQLERENAELKVIIKEKDSLLKEKERTIQILESVHAKTDATTGGLMQIMRNEQGHVSGIIAHCDDLTRILPGIEVPATRKVEAVGNTGTVQPQPHPQPPEEKDEKDSAQETEANLHNMENNKSPTLEAAKTEHKTFEKPPRKVKSDGKFTNKQEARSPTAKGTLKFAKSTKLDDEPVKGSTDPVEKPVDDKPDVEDDTKPYNLSSQQTIYNALPKNKPKSDDNIDESKLGTPV